MKTISLLVLLAPAGAAIAFVSGYPVAGASMIGVGIVAFAAAEYGRAKPRLLLVSTVAEAPVHSASERHPLAA